MQPARLDVTDWSRTETNTRHPLWWGILGLAIIELTTVAGFLASYFYLGVAQGESLRLSHLGTTWPPPGVAPLPLLYESLNLGLLAVCALSMWYGGHAMRQRRRGLLVALFVVCTVAGLAVLVLRGLQLAALPFSYRDHAYGSIVWVTTGFHFLHVTSAVVGTVVIGTLAARGYYDDEAHFIGVDVDTLYWYFVTGVWVPIYLVLYWVPRVLA